MYVSNRYGLSQHIWAPSSEVLWHKNKPFTIYTLQCPDPALLTLSSQHLLLSESASYQPVQPESLWHPGKSVRQRSPPKLSKNCWSHPATLLFPVTVEIVCFSFPGCLQELCVCSLSLCKSSKVSCGVGVKERYASIEVWLKVVFTSQLALQFVFKYLQF